MRAHFEYMVTCMDRHAQTVTTHTDSRAHAAAVVKEHQQAGANAIYVERSRPNAAGIYHGKSSIWRRGKGWTTTMTW